MTFESKLRRNIHVIGDAASRAACRNRPSAANAQAKAAHRPSSSCAAGRAPETPGSPNLYNTVEPDYGNLARRQLSPRGTCLADVEGGAASPVNAPAILRAREAAYAEAGFKTITAEVFG